MQTTTLAIASAFRRLSATLLVSLIFVVFSGPTEAAPGDENWHTRFSGQPIGGEVRAIVPWNGEIYAAGQFNAADGTNAQQVAKWNGTKWTSLNTGLYADEPVSLMTTNNEGVIIMSLYERLLKWNGSAWSALGGNFHPEIQQPAALCGHLSDLYVSAHSISGNIVPTTGPGTLARWDGSSWLLLTSTNAVMNVMKVKDNVLYGGGAFHSVGGSIYGFAAATNIARWNGTNWLTLGAGVNGPVHAMAFSGNDLYVGGDFTRAGTVTAARVAKWNGTTWSAVGFGFNGPVRDLTVNGTTLYASGLFTASGATAAAKLARWTGTAWSALNIPMLGNSVLALDSLGTNIYIGGRIDFLGTNRVGNIVSYGGSNWQPLKTGVSFAHVNVLRTIGTNVYAGGDWRYFGATNSPGLVRFDGSNWIPIGAGISNSVNPAVVYDIHSFNNDLFIGGRFDFAGGISARNVARWDGSAWHPLGAGLPTLEVYGGVYSLVHHAGELFAGGGFSAGAATNLAKWNGAAWSQVGATSPSFRIRTLGAAGDTLYAGGSFGYELGAPFLGRWNGSAWSGVSSSQFNAPVFAMAFVGTNLYVGGPFDQIGSNTRNFIARWNGTSWASLGTGLNDWVTTMLAVGTNLYVGGYFTTAGGVTANRIAKWNGSSWSALGSGIGGAGSVVSALALRGDDLIVGGAFTSAGGQPCHHLAIWRLQSPGLRVLPQGNSLSLSWPAGLTPFRLQSISHLSATNWTDLPQSPALSNDVYQVLTDAPGTSQFFRLRRN